MLFKQFLYVLFLIKILILGKKTCNGSFFSSVGDFMSDGTKRVRNIFLQPSIPADFKKLQFDLETKVYGQHLIHDVVINALQSHWDSKTASQKALVLSFHGWPGNGKNYVTQIIIESLYNDENTDYVHFYTGRIDFPSHTDEKILEYQNKIQKTMKEKVKQNPKQMFVFDEVDKMPVRVLDIIKPMIDYRKSINGIDFRQAIFIFLSNTGGTQINNHYLHLWKDQGLRREDMKLAHFEKMIAKGAFNDNGMNYFDESYWLQPINDIANIIGGLFRSDNIKSNLIDFYIPFLPMERKHLLACVLDQFKQRGCSNPMAEHIEEALEHITWGPRDVELFSVTGCKGISQRVGMIISKNRNVYAKNEL